MTDEQHLWACALAVERQHGAGAETFATHRIEELAEQGYAAGVKEWRAIRARLTRLRTGGHA